MVYSIHIDFWGLSTCVEVGCYLDIEYLEYYFRDLITDNHSEPYINIRLATDHAYGFFDALLIPETLKQIFLKVESGKWNLYEEFYRISSKPSVLPPFFIHPQIVDSYIAHASCVAIDHGKSFLLSGPSYSGKSTLALGLARRGMSLLSDDLTIVKKDRSIIPFFRPMTVREDIHTRLPWLFKLIASKNIETRKIRHLTLIRVDELFPIKKRINWKFAGLVKLTNIPDSSTAHLKRLSSIQKEQALNNASLGSPPISTKRLLLKSVDFFEFIYNLDMGVEELVDQLINGLIHE